MRNMRKISLEMIQSRAPVFAQGRARGPDTDVVPWGLVANLKKVRAGAPLPRGAHHQVARDTGNGDACARRPCASRRGFAAHSSQVSNRMPRRAYLTRRNPSAPRTTASGMIWATSCAMTPT